MNKLKRIINRSSDFEDSLSMGVHLLEVKPITTTLVDYAYSDAIDF